MTSKLFSAGRIGSLSIPNRVVMTAMGIAQSATDGSVTDTEIAFYRERALGGVGLIITECMIVNWQSGRGNLHQTAVCDDANIAGLAKLVAGVHDTGTDAKIVAQIYHPGRQGFVHVNGTQSQPAPSDVPDAMTQQPVHAMSLSEIDSLVEDFAAAAQRLKQAGFDGVEIHAAHGYLLNSFLSPNANLRTDEYGGTTENRARIVSRIVARVRELCGSDFAIIVRFSVDEFLETVGKPGEGITVDEGVAIAKCLAESGFVDALDVSSGVYETMNTAWEPFPYDEGWKSHLAARVKEAVELPVIGVSVYRNPTFAEQLLQEGKLDFVGSARAHFADPHWARKAKLVLAGGAGEVDAEDGARGEVAVLGAAGSEALSVDAAAIRRCISCLACMETLVAADETGKPAYCAINPRTAREQIELKRDGNGRRVVVVGAGPAGLEAAVTAAKRGFAVTLLEKESAIGGQLNYASQPPGKEKVNWLIGYYDNRIKALGIDLRLNTAATPEELAKLALGETPDETPDKVSGRAPDNQPAAQPAAVILAVGSEPVLPKAIPGLDAANVHTPPAILDGTVSLAGKEVVVVGSGMTGIETTELLAEQGCKLSLFEMVPDIGPGVYFQNMMDIMPKLGAHGVQFFPSHRLLSIEGNTATFERVADDATDCFVIKADAFVVSLGTRPLTAFVQAVQELVPGAVAIGDSSKPGRIMDATSAGWEAARLL